ncbi:MAG: hypothetical protein CVT80_05270 [Alphaproteobacteria bacterium HGW-Alphaproteobacteria-2]|nr:MAG: hypothetical protein CVT80_05270 [Alphaproteobacteria bacterium HGW-Alphaproteobacteria-2]
MFEACVPLFKPLLLICAVTIGFAIASVEQGGLRATQAGKTSNGRNVSQIAREMHILATFFIV